MEKTEMSGPEDLGLLKSKKAGFETPFEPQFGLPEHRIKSSLKLNYLAQVEVIKNQIGSLESIRKTLGLSQRQISQLLMVDPSAWTRWQRPGEEAPPHIYRALQWYMTIQEKIPGLTAQYFIGKPTQILQKEVEQELGQIKLDYKELNRVLNALQNRQRRLNVFFVATIVLLLGSIFLISLKFL